MSDSARAKVQFDGFDVRGNRLNINGQWVGGRHRWEALVMQSLLSAAETDPASHVSRLELDGVLAKAGQWLPLTRAQWWRLWRSLSVLVDQAAGEGSFAARLRFPARSKTVGPWRWLVDQRMSVPASTARQAEDAPMAAVLMHRITAMPDWPGALRLLRKLALCHVVWAAGSRRAAVEDFRSGPEWAAASPELLTHRNLYVADALIMLGRYDEAEQEIADALERIRLHPSCRDQVAFASMLAAALPPYRGGDDASSQLQNRLWSSLALDQAPGAQLDYVNRAWTLNMLGRGYASTALAAPEAAKRSQAVATLIAVHEAAIMCSGLAGRWDVLTYCLDVLAGNLGIVSKNGDRASALLALETHLCARLWRQKLDPPDTMNSGELHLGELWCQHPWLSDHVRALELAGVWIGSRPDSPEFLRQMLAIAEKSEDPFLVAGSSLVAAKLCQLQGRPEEERLHRRRLEAQVQATPEFLHRVVLSKMLHDDDDLRLATHTQVVCDEREVKSGQ